MTSLCEAGGGSQHCVKSGLVPCSYDPSAMEVETAEPGSQAHLPLLGEVEAYMSHMRALFKNLEHCIGNLGEKTVSTWGPLT